MDFPLDVGQPIFPHVMDPQNCTAAYIHAKARKAQEQYIAELGIVDDSQPTDNGCSLRVQQIAVTMKGAVE